MPTAEAVLTTELSDPRWYDEEERRLWREARSLNALAEVVASWLEGRIWFSPWFYGPLDEETLPLAPLLARLNRRAGFVTVDSAPGSRGDGWAQRAYLSGFCDRSFARKIKAATASTRLVAVVWPPLRAPGPVRAAARAREAARFRRAGTPPFPPAFGFEGWIPAAVAGDLLSGEVLDALSRAARVTVFDQLHDRNDLLWQVLDRVVAGA